MDQRDPVREFLRLHLTALGAVVEEDAAGLDALLPAEVSADLQLPEVVRLCLDGSSDDTAGGVVDARLGSAALERAVAARRERHPVATVALAGELPRPLPDRLPVLLNAVRAGPVAPHVRVAARYLVAHLRLTLRGDEVRSALVDCTVRLEDGARVPALAVTHAYPVAALPLTAAERQTAAEALRRAVLQAAPVALAGALAAIGRRAQRDLARIAEYYTSLDTEMTRAVARARSGDERQRRLAKRALLPDELAARRAQLRERLSARVTAELIAAVLVETETDRYAHPVRRRTRSGTVNIQRRAADGALEGPRCAGCGTSALHLYLCDEHLHALCEQCGHDGRLDPPRCLGCRPPGVPALAVSVEDVTPPLQRSGEPAP